MAEKTALTREVLDRLSISVGGKFAFGCATHHNAPLRAIYQDGEVRLLCTACGFEAHRVKVALAEGNP